MDTCHENCIKKSLTKKQKKNCCVSNPIDWNKNVAFKEVSNVYVSHALWQIKQKKALNRFPLNVAPLLTKMHLQQNYLSTDGRSLSILIYHRGCAMIC